MSNASAVGPEKTANKKPFRAWQGILAVLAFVACAVIVFRLMKPPETPLAHAITMIKQGKAAAALPLLEQLSRQHPDNPLVFPWLAQCYLRTDRIAEGRTALDTALRLKLSGKELAPVVLAYANYYESKGDYAEAERLYQSADRVCSATDLTEGLARLYLGWSEADMAQGQLELAVHHLELANAHPDQLAEPLKSLIPHRLSAAYRDLAGICQSKDKDDKRARKLLERSLEISEEPATRMALAALCTRLGDKENAITNYQIVAKSDPNNLEARHRLIDLLLEKKDYEHVQEALTDLTDKEKSVEDYQLLATVDLKLGNYPGAVRAFEDACELQPKIELLKQLKAVLMEWHDELVKQNKPDQAASVAGHADRIDDQIAEMSSDKDKDKQNDNSNSANNPVDAKAAPVAVVSSRIWLARGSLTPEGEIKIHNGTGAPITDLSLNAVFYDNTARRTCGSVGLPVASPQSAPFPADGSRSLYFSCPNIVKTDHQLAVMIFWKQRFLKEFPVVKQQ